MAANSTGRLTVSPSVIYFGNVIQGQVKRISCTVTNTGSGSVAISRAASSQPMFSVATPRLPDVVPAGGKAVFTVTFAPKSLQHSDAGIVFTSNASNSSFALPIHGTGVRAGTLRTTAWSLAFGKVQVGAGAATSLTLTNIGFTNVKISSKSVTGTGFSVSGLTLPTTLAASESLTFKVNFKPPNGGVRSGKLTVNSSATNPALNIALWGDGTLAGTLAPSPATLYFGSVATGASSYRSATLQATGGSIVVSSASTGSSEFALTGVTFPLTIASGQTATLHLRFTPQSTGLATAMLKFQSNAANATPAMALQGHGVGTQHSVLLSWSPSNSAAAGYNIYRGTQAGGPYSKINASLHTSTSYSDTSVAAGDTYYYVTTAAASDGSESGYSNQVKATIPSP